MPSLIATQETTQSRTVAAGAVGCVGLLWGLRMEVYGDLCGRSSITDQVKSTQNILIVVFRFQFPQGSVGSSPIIRTKKLKDLIEEAILNRMAFFAELYPKLYPNESGFIWAYRLVFLEMCFFFCCS